MTSINRIQKTRSIQIKDEEWTKLEQLADRLTEGNKSLMMRVLIREKWASNNPATRYCVRDLWHEGACIYGSFIRLGEDKCNAESPNPKPAKEQL